MHKMSRSKSIVHLVFSLLLATSLVSAWDVADLLQRRQNVPLSTGPTGTSTGITSITLSSASASTPDTSTTLSTPSSTPTPTSDSTTVTTPSSPTADATRTQTTTAAAVSTTKTPLSTSTFPTSALVAISTPTNQQTTAATQTTTIPPSSFMVETTVLFVTQSGTYTYTSAYKTSALVAAASASGTSAPGLNGGPGGSGSTGPAQSTIIGVVCGIGGAILLGGLAFVAWRIRRKNRRSADDVDELMGTQLGSATHEKPTSSSENSPFKSTLDQYHNPAGKINTAANF